MIFYFATGSHNMTRRMLRLGVRNILLSYAFGKNPQKWTYLNDLPNLRLLVDSGAFSVWQSGVRISPEEYRDFCCELGRLLRCEVAFVSLDVIPEQSVGCSPSIKQVTAACAQSVANYDSLRATGLRVVPVFHQHEPFEMFEYYRRYTDWIGAGSDQALSPTQRFRYLSGLLHKVGPTARIHGFGIGSKTLMYRLPLFSCDASSFVRIHEEYGPRLQGRHVAHKAANYLLARNVRRYLTLERQCTEVWTSRGVTWSDSPSNDPT